MPTKGRGKLGKRGGSVPSIVKKAMSEAKKAANIANRAIKKHKLISRGLAKAGYNVPAMAAGALGYGKKKRKGNSGARRKPCCHGRGKRGGSLFGDVLSKVTSLPAGLLVGGTMGLQGAIKGLGKKGKRGGAVYPRQYQQGGIIRRNWETKPFNGHRALVA